MWKRILLITIGVVAIGAGVAYYLGYFEKEKPKQVSPAIDAIPSNAAFIIEWKSISNFRQLENSDNNILQSLKNSGLLTEAFNNFSFIDSLLHSDSTVFHAFNDQPVFISAHLSGVKKFNFLFTTNLPERIDSSHIEQFFKRRFKDHQISSRLYDGSTVYEIREGEQSLFAYSIINSVFIGSRSTVLTEEGIRHIRHGKSLRKDPNFSKVMETSKGRESGTVYINYKVLTSFTELFLTKAAHKEFNLTTHFANWSASDIKIKSDAILLSGYIFSNDTNNNYLNIYKDLKPQQIRFHDLLPSNVSFCYWSGVENIKTFFRNYYSWLENSNRFFNTQNRLKEFNALHKTKFPDDLSSFCGNEFFYFTTEKQPSDTVSTGTYLAFEITDTEKAISYFRKFRPADLEDTLSVTVNDIVFTTLHLGDLMDLTGLSSFSIECNYAAQLGDYLVFAPVREDLLKLAANISNGNTLRKSAIYQDINEYLPNEASLFIFDVPFRSKQLPPKLFEFKETDGMAQLAGYITDHSVVAMQISSSKDLFYQDLLLKYNPEAAKEQIPSWEADSENKLAFVQAVNDEGSEGVFTVDVKNKLSFYDSNGSLKFTKQLQGSLNGKIMSLPVKSEDPVYLIPCASELVAVNAQGIDQEGFPLKIKSLYTTVVDYDDKKDPRIIVGTASGKVMMYNGKGKPVPTFQATDVRKKLTSPPLYIRIGTKDYLTFATEDQLVFTDRKGKTLFTHQSDDMVTGTLKPLKRGNSVYASYLSKKGKIILVSPDKKSATTLKEVTAGIEFYYEDIDKDRKKELILVDSSSIKLASDSGNIKKVIQIPMLKDVMINKTPGGLFISYTTGTETGVISPSGYPSPGLPVEADGISISSMPGTFTYYLIRGKKIYKFVTMGH